ncbi:chloride channel protein [Frankia sp. CcI49]|uniref:chloride channel protein n=1 Tax=Frankia sp. CcI49 TaxID=1745382 RepID=UPI001F521D47|nr:chloride channel protein [Frankia sp. CcI49]
MMVGAGVGLAAVGFRWLIVLCTEVFCGREDCSVAGHTANPHVPALGLWFLLLAPVAGGVLYGPLINRFAREARGHGVPEVMYAVAEHDGRIAPRVSAVKSFASALCIGAGGSVGREGPIVQIGSALGSALGQVARVGAERLPVLVACGAGGGIAATFNAPLAGVMFACEVILASFTAEAFGVVVLAAVSASVVGRAVLGSNPFLTLPPFAVRSAADYPLFALLGVFGGVTGVAFTRVLYAVEDGCDRVWRGPEWLRPAVGGLLLGAVLIALPQMYGVGYPVLERAVGGRYGLGLLALLLVGKIVATSLTIGIGGSGGVFAPSLFVGAVTGAAFGLVAHDAAGQLVAPVGAYALVGMGAVFAGAARAPITAVLILFELTGEYTIILPLMAAVVIATLTSALLSHETIYTLKLTRRGVDLDASHQSRRLRNQPITAALGPPPEALPAAVPLRSAAVALARAPHGCLPLVDDAGRYQGVITVKAVADALDVPSRATRSAGHLAVQRPSVTTASSLADALDAFEGASSGGIVVLDPRQGHIVGWITHQSILAAMHPPPASRQAAATLPGDGPQVGDQPSPARQAAVVVPEAGAD